MLKSLWIYKIGEIMESFRNIIFPQPMKCRDCGVEIKTELSKKDDKNDTYNLKLVMTNGIFHKTMNDWYYLCYDCRDGKK